MMEYLDYPIVTERDLPAVLKRGAFGLGRRARPSSDIPSALAGQVRVYRVGSEYVLDRGQLRPESEEVVDATHVSVVDTRTNRTIPVNMSLASTEGRDFTAVVSFACTVNEAITVVRDGTVNAQEHLLSHIKSHRALFELGSKRTFDEIDFVRRDVHAEVTAFITVVPPEIEGMTVRLLGIEVLTPEEWAKTAAEIAAENREQKLAALKVENQHDISDIHAKRHFIRDHDVALGEAEIEAVRTRSDVDQTEIRTRGDLDMADLRLERHLLQHGKVRDVITDTKSANVWTYVTRERSAADLTAGFREDRSLDYAHQQLEREYVTAERRERQAGMREILHIMYKLGALENLEVDARRLLHELAYGETPPDQGTTGQQGAVGVGHGTGGEARGDIPHGPAGDRWADGAQTPSDGQHVPGPGEEND